MSTSLRAIAILGPESSGKTSLCAQLAEHLQCAWVPEYAREYQPKQAGIYTEADLLTINREQQKRHYAALERAQALGDAYVIVDTEAIVLAVWAQLSLGYVPAEIEHACETQVFSDYLLLAPDLPWQSDPLRSAPELVQRQKIFVHYEAWLNRYQRPYSIIRGSGEQRLASALQALGLPLLQP